MLSEIGRTAGHAIVIDARRPSGTGHRQDGNRVEYQPTMPILDQFLLTNHRALVTGGGRGIGRALALALAEAGADVAVADIDQNTAESTAETLRSLGFNALAVRADVTKVPEVTAMVDAVTAEWGQLDIAVNNAGVAEMSDAESIEEGGWNAVLDVNLKGVFFCCREEARVMLPRESGSIINVASMSAQIVNRPQHHAHYNASKAAVVQMTKTCAAEWATHGVRVNCISPGHMDTPMTAEMDDEARATWVTNTPMERIGTPADLQGAAVFLASAASAYITGHDLVIDGGYTIW